MRGTDLEAMVGPGETILWRGKPLKKCFILECIFNPMLFFALIWALVDLGFIGGIFMNDSGMDSTTLFSFVFFFVVHLMPVWMYLGGVLLSFRRYRNTEYIVTDKGIYVSGGTFAYTNEMKPFAELSHVNIHRGILDQFLGVGDVVTVCSHMSIGTSSQHAAHSAHGLSICDIADYQKVFSMIKELQTDIYSDTMYPNDLRPKENHGYQTEYTKKDSLY